MSHTITGWEHQVQNRKGQPEYQEVTSSRANNTPPTGDLKAAATPAAQPQVTYTQPTHMFIPWSSSPQKGSKPNTILYSVLLANPTCCYVVAQPQVQPTKPIFLVASHQNGPKPYNLKAHPAFILATSLDSSPALL
jgi:hypothetical protein